MAPPQSSPAVRPLQDRLLELVKTLQFSWFMGHFTLLLCTLYYTIAAVRFRTASGLAPFSYRLAFLSAAVTYGIVVFKQYRGKVSQGQLPQQLALKLVADENVQYLVMALVWLYSKQIWFALLPFTVYSTFHFLTYLRTNVIPCVIPPTIVPPQSPGAQPKLIQHPISESISKFVKQNYDASMHLVSNLEIFLFVRVLFGVVLFVNSWVLLISYSAFLRMRYAQSEFVRQAFFGLEMKGDALANDSRIPPAVKNVWVVVKDVVKKIGEATSFVKTFAPGSGARKSQ